MRLFPGLPYVLIYLNQAGLLKKTNYKSTIFLYSTHTKIVYVLCGNGHSSAPVCKLRQARDISDHSEESPIVTLNCKHCLSEAFEKFGSV